MSGLAGSGWRPASSPMSEPSGHSPSNVAMDAGQHSIIGEVRGFQVHTELATFAFGKGAGPSQTVWRFRVERYDSSGKRLLAVPVEMRSFRFFGSINDGDRVEIHGSSVPGTIIQPKRIRNLTTGAVVNAASTFSLVFQALVIVAIAFLVLALFATIVFRIFLSHAPHLGLP